MSLLVSNLNVAVPLLPFGAAYTVFAVREEASDVTVDRYVVVSIT